MDDQNHKIEVDVYLEHYPSFEALMNDAPYTETWRIIADAITNYGTYRRYALDQKDMMIVVYDDLNDLLLINDRHRQPQKMTILLPKSEFEFPDGVTLDAVGAELSRALIFYEHLVFAESEGLKKGIYDSAQGIVANYRHSCSPIEPAAPAPKAPYLQ